MRDPGRVQRDPNLPFQEIEGQVVIVVPARRQMHQLDEVATFLWKRLKEPRSPEELVESLCDEFEVEPSRAGKDLESFLTSLEEKGLLKTS